MGVGAGTQDNPFLIGTDTALREIATQVNQGKFSDSCFKLTADIDLDSKPYSVIGYADPGGDGNPFSGVFDGDSHTISNLYINEPKESYQGLFGINTGTIRNVNLDNVYIYACQNSGGLAGKNFKGLIENCRVKGEIRGEGFYYGEAFWLGGLIGSNGGDVRYCNADVRIYCTGVSGGLIGVSDFGTIEYCSASGDVINLPNGIGTCLGGLIGDAMGVIRYCHATGSVSGNDEVGGLTGRGAVISFCYASGNIIGRNKVGGLVGQLGSISSSYATGNVTGESEVGGLAGGDIKTITNSYSTGNVSGKDSIGGLMGYTYSSTISNSYATGSVTGEREVGGLIGRNNDQSTVSNSFWDKEASGQSSSAGGGEGKTTREMKCFAMIEALGLEAWRYDVQAELNQGYPVLAWQGGISQPWSGNGTADTPFLIGTPADLKEIAAQVNAGKFVDSCFKLTADIDLDTGADSEFTPIGRVDPMTSDVPFSGSFDGGNHKISNLYINKSSSFGKALFGYLNGALIQNLHLDSAYINGGNYAAVLAGKAIASRITNISVEGILSGSGTCGGAVALLERCCLENIVATVQIKAATLIGGVVGQADTSILQNIRSTSTVKATTNSGGIAGQLTDCTVSDCHASGVVDGTWYVGGAFGSVTGGTLEKSSAAGNVSGTSDYVGGLIGAAESTNVSRCFAAGNVSGPGPVGGLIGVISNASVLNVYATGSVTASGSEGAGGLIGLIDEEGMIENVYASGAVEGPANVGGLVGIYSSQASVSNAFFDRETTRVDTDLYAVGKTTAEMKNPKLVNLLGVDSWRWDNTSALNHGYPVLAWQGGIIPPEPPVPPKPVPPNVVVSVGKKVEVSADSFHLSEPLSRKTKLEAKYSVPFPKPGKPVPQKKLSVKMVSDTEFLIKGSIRLLNQKEYGLALKNVQTNTTSKVLAADSGIWKIQKDSVLTTVAVKLKGKEHSDAIIITVVPPAIDSYVILDSNYVVVSVKEAGSNPKAFFEYLETQRNLSLKLKKVNLDFVPEKKWEKIGINFNSIFPNQEIAVFKTSAKKLSKLSNRVGEFNLVLDNRNGLDAK